MNVMKYIKIIYLTQFILSIFTQNDLLASDEITEKKELRAKTLLSEQQENIEAPAKSPTYYFNEEQNVVHFYPTKPSWEKKLNSTEYFSSHVFTRAGLSFKGEVNLERFLDAMHNTLQDFDYLFAKIHLKQDDRYASYATEDGNKPFVQLEIEKKEETINASTFDSILPVKVDERLKNVVTDQLKALPMGAFKLTTFSDGFTIGYYFNHAFFDQSSIFYFLKYLSHIYSYGKDELSLKKPNLIDIDCFSVGVPSPQSFKNREDFRKYDRAPMGYRYRLVVADDATPLPKLENYITISINFNTAQINKLKSTVKQYLSVNDIIHATLLKIYSLDPNLPMDKVFSFRFACNMRKYCGLGEETLGNILSHPLMLITLEDIKNKTILELASLNRQCMAGVNLDFFKEGLVWYKHFQEYHEDPLRYTPAFSLLNATATNWATFNYDSILFDSVSPIELKEPCLAPFRVNVISFDHKESEKILTSSISIPACSLSSLRKLMDNTEYFSYTLRK